MARMRPELRQDQVLALASRAEARVYQALRAELPDDVLVIHSATWLYRSRSGAIVEGEGDFTVFLPQSGFVTIEVKGGGIAYNGKTSAWSSIDRNNVPHVIKDPFRQAQRQRHAILEQLIGHPAWQGKRVHCGHAVLFPDLPSAAALEGPGRPRAIIGDQGDVRRLGAWINRVIQFWATSTPVGPLGSNGVELAERILCSSIEVRPLLSVTLAQEEEIRIRLTDQQARVLRIIGARSRALIGGGAGTGKTLIALEKARRVALEGKSTVMICYNRRLADTLRRTHSAISGLDVLSYHQLCERRIVRARAISGRDVLQEARDAYAGADLYDTQLPFALALANEIIPEKYHAVIVDEAQDFSDEYWLGVDGLLADPQHDPLYVFFDPNQLIYKRRGSLPIDDEPFWLTTNCRNTHHIHQAAYRFYSGEAIDPPEITGVPLAKLIAESTAGQADSIVKEVGRLVTTESLRPSDIVILVMGKPKQSYYDLLTARRLARGLKWAVEEDDLNAVLLDTVSRFKGLEAAVVFLWLPALIDGVQDRELLYVGLSRGKSIVYLVGSKDACAAVSASHAASARACSGQT